MSVNSIHLTLHSLCAGACGLPVASSTPRPAARRELAGKFGIPVPSRSNCLLTSTNTMPRGKPEVRGGEKGKGAKGKVKKGRAESPDPDVVAGKHDKAFKRKLNAERRRIRDSSYQADASKFRQQLMNAGCLIIREVAGDGNCLFRAISDQMTGRETRHDAYRQQCCQFMTDNEDDFAPFLLEEENHGSFSDYVAAMRRNREWGGNLELQALSLALNVNIVVHQLDQPRWELCNHDARVVRTISISYHDGDHYNSVRALSDDTDGPAVTIDYKTLTPLGSAAHRLPSDDIFASKDEGSKVQLIMASLPRHRRPPIPAIVRMLSDMRGDVDACIEAFLAAINTEEEAEEKRSAGARVVLPVEMSVATSGSGVKAAEIPFKAVCDGASTALPLQAVGVHSAGDSTALTWTCTTCSYEDTPHSHIQCDICDAPRPVLPCGSPFRATGKDVAADTVPVEHCSVTGFQGHPPIDTSTIAPTSGGNAGTSGAAAHGSGSSSSAVADKQSNGASAASDVPPRRNGPCPCGSILVYRRCCLSVDLAAKAKRDALFKKMAEASGGAESKQKAGKERRKPRRKGGAGDDDSSDSSELDVSVVSVRI